MQQLLFTVVITIFCFVVVLGVVGSGIGISELAIWTVLLVATVWVEVALHRRRKDVATPR